MMYYKPWTVSAFKAQGYPHQTSVFYDRLHRAHRVVADSMDVLQKTRNMRIDARVSAE